MPEFPPSRMNKPLLIAMHPGLFSAEECRRVASLSLKFKPGTTTGDDSHRVSDIAWLEESENAWVYERLDGAVARTPLRVISSPHPDSIQYTRYGVGGRYRVHRDSDWPATYRSRIRVLSTTVIIQPADRGGLLRLIPDGGEPVPIRLKIGDAVLFPSRAKHEVTEVEKGQRISLVRWWQGSIDQW